MKKTISDSSNNPTVVAEGTIAICMSDIIYFESYVNIL